MCRLWLKVSEAIAKDDQYAATEQKTILEEDQRRRAKSGVPHATKFFKHNASRDIYEYIYAESVHIGAFSTSFRKYWFIPHNGSARDF